MNRRKVRKNPQHVYHGGRLTGPLEIRPHAKGRGEHGAGIYTTTAWTTARTFSRGGAIFRLTLADKITWLDDVALPLDVIRKFLAGLPRLKNRKAIDADLAHAAARQQPHAPFPLLWFHNILINNDATVGQNGPAITQFLIDNGVDAAHQYQGGGEDWVIIFNPDIVLKVEKLDPAKAGKDYPFDQPRVRKNPADRSTARARDGSKIPTTYFAAHGRQPPIAKRVAELVAEAVDYLDERPPWYSVDVEVHLLGYTQTTKRFPHDRDMAYVEQGDSHWRGYKNMEPYCEYTIHINAYLLVNGPKARIEGVLRHEIAHVVLMAKHKRHTEQDADDLAWAMFGDRINYDEDDIQTIAPGVHPRPRRLPR